MLTSEELSEALDRLAEKFENNLQPSPDCDARGWGQFLDNPRSQQVGPYGTCAGLIVLTLAGRGKSFPVTEAQKLLDCWWGQRDNPADKAHSLYVQTLRLAFQHLAVRLSTIASTDHTVWELRKALLDRLLPSELWGNYWTNEQTHDATPRAFPSSLAVLSFAMMSEDSRDTDKRVLTATEKLETKFTLSSGLSLLERVAIATALIATNGSALKGKVRRRVGRLARSLHGDLNAQGTYFFDFEFLPNTQNRVDGRDYFIVSPEILLAVAGFQVGAPPSLRLMAERTVELLNNNLKQNDHAYKPNVGPRISTMDQAWAALLLYVARSKHKSPSRFSKIVYGLLRSRKDNWFTGKFLPAFSTLAMIALNVLARDAGLALQIFSALGLSVTSSIYGPRYFRKLLPGREDI